jgi:hypothetical protein
MCQAWPGMAYCIALGSRRRRQTAAPTSHAHACSHACTQFGVVNVAFEKKTGVKYAIKSMNKRKAEADPNFSKDIRTEVRTAVCQRVNRGERAFARAAQQKLRLLTADLSLIFLDGAPADCQVEIMYHLGGHKNIVQLYEVYEDAEAIHLILVREQGNWGRRAAGATARNERFVARPPRVTPPGQESGLHDHSL